MVRIGLSGHSSNRRGTGLAMVLLMSSVLAIMVAAVGLNTMTHLQGTNANLYRKQSRHAAYGGVQWALANLAKNNAWTPGKNPYILDFTGNGAVTVELHVYNNCAGALGNPYREPNGVLVPKGATYIVAVGCAANQKSLSTSAMSTLAYNGQEIPSSALFADQRLEMEDSETDSWSSLTDNTRNRYSPSLAMAGASIGTNATEGSVILTNARVKGGLLLGANGQRTQAVIASEGSNILGETKTESGVIRIQARKPPEWLEQKADNQLAVIESGGAVEPGSYDAIRVGKGDTLRLSSGTYYVRNTLSLDGARLVIEPPGPVTIYVGGRFSVTGDSRINPDDVGPDILEVGQSTSGLPGNLQVHMVGNGNLSVRPTFELTGGSKAWMSVSGRNLTGTIKSSELFGSLKGEVLSVKSGKVHFDEATRTMGFQVGVPASASTPSADAPPPDVAPSTTGATEIDPASVDAATRLTSSDTSTVEACVVTRTEQVCAPVQDQ